MNFTSFKEDVVQNLNIKIKERLQNEKQELVQIIYNNNDLNESIAAIAIPAVIVWLGVISPAYTIAWRKLHGLSVEYQERCMEDHNTYKEKHKCIAQGMVDVTRKKLEILERARNDADENFSGEKAKRYNTRLSYEINKLQKILNKYQDIITTQNVSSAEKEAKKVKL